jgi:hypothetical protein
MSDSAKQNFPSGKVKVITAGHAESYADYRDKREYQQSAQVLTFDWQQISSNKHSVKILFTKFTLLITIQVLPPEHHQSIFVALTLKGYEK